MYRIAAVVASLAMILVSATAARSAEGALLVREAQDVVKLVDGTEVAGTLLAVGMKAVVIIVKADAKENADAAAGKAEQKVEEITIPRERVERIVRGTESPDPTGYTVAVVAGVKRVTGKAQATAAAEGGNGSKPPAAAASRPPAASTPAAPSAPASKTTAGQPTTDGLIAAARQDARLKQLIDSMGEDRVRQLIEQNRGNKQASQLIEQFLRGGQIPPFLMPLLSAPKQN
jgi:hypothetical protein